MIRDSKRKKDLFNLAVILSKKCERFQDSDSFRFELKDVSLCFSFLRFIHKLIAAAVMPPSKTIPSMTY